MFNNVPFLQVKDISKIFTSVLALNNVNFECNLGEVHAIVGVNGAGKSTLMKIIMAVIQPDKGDILISGQKVKISKPFEAQALGVNIIYQDLNLIPHLTVAENIFLGHEIKGKFLIDWQKTIMKAEEILSLIGVGLNLNLEVRNLTIAQQQLIAICRVLSFDSKIIIMDEPTASISQGEIDHLFDIIKLLKNSGKGVIYISHKIGEVFKIADRITVLKDGENIGVRKVNETDITEIINMMAGRKIEKSKKFYVEKLQQETVFKCVNLTKREKFYGVNLEIKGGEIVGIIGIEGQGQRELLRSIFGIERYDSGEIFIKGIKKNIKTPKQAIEAGLAFISDDRKGEGVISCRPIFENATLASLYKWQKFNFINKRKETNEVQKFVKKLDVRTPSIYQNIEFLSGGNQQKVSLIKWIFADALVLLLDEPTKGIDVAAKVEIYKLIRMLAKQGKAILVNSREIQELISTTDRILVLFAGKIIANIKTKDTTETYLMKACTTSV